MPKMELNPDTIVINNSSGEVDVTIDIDRENGTIVAKEYDSNGNVTREVSGDFSERQFDEAMSWWSEGNGSGAYDFVDNLTGDIIYNYNDNGELVSKDTYNDQMEQISHTEYDGAERVVSETSYDMPGYGENYTTTETEYGENGEIKSITTEVNKDDGFETDSKVTTEYYREDGSVESKTENRVTEDEMGKVSVSARTAYDENGIEVKSVSTETREDENGKIEQRTRTETTREVDANGDERVSETKTTFEGRETTIERTSTLNGEFQEKTIEVEKSLPNRTTVTEKYSVDADGNRNFEGDVTEQRFDTGDLTGFGDHYIFKTKVTETDAEGRVTRETTTNFEEPGDEISSVEVKEYNEDGSYTIEKSDFYEGTKETVEYGIYGNVVSETTERIDTDTDNPNDIDNESFENPNDIANELFDEGPIESNLTDITDNDSDRIDNDSDRIDNDSDRIDNEPITYDGIDTDDRIGIDDGAGIDDGIDIDGETNIDAESNTYDGIDTDDEINTDDEIGADDEIDIDDGIDANIEKEPDDISNTDDATYRIDDENYGESDSPSNDISDIDENEVNDAFVDDVGNIYDAENDVKDAFVDDVGNTDDANNSIDDENYGENDNPSNDISDIDENEVKDAFVAYLDPDDPDIMTKEDIEEISKEYSDAVGGGETAMESLTGIALDAASEYDGKLSDDDKPSFVEKLSDIFTTIKDAVGGAIEKIADKVESFTSGSVSLMGVLVGVAIAGAITGAVDVTALKNDNVTASPETRTAIEERMEKTEIGDDNLTTIIKSLSYEIGNAVDESSNPTGKIEATTYSADGDVETQTRGAYIEKDGGIEGMTATIDYREDGSVETVSKASFIENEGNAVINVTSVSFDEEGNEIGKEFSTIDTKTNTVETASTTDTSDETEKTEQDMDEDQYDDFSYDTSDWLD